MTLNNIWQRFWKNYAILTIAGLSSLLLIFVSKELTGFIWLSWQLLSVPIAAITSYPLEKTSNE
jgi:hypothetical protein